MSTLLNLISRKVIIFWKIPILTNCRFRLDRKRNNTISQMRLGSVFKMRISILNTATTEQMGYGIISFFVYTKSTNQDLSNNSLGVIAGTLLIVKSRIFRVIMKLAFILDAQTICKASS